MKKLLARLQAWLRRESYVRAVVAEAAKNAYIEGHKAAFGEGYRGGYEVGRAHGELIGREALALELQQAHGIVDGGERSMTSEEVRDLKVKQRH